VILKLIAHSPEAFTMGKVQKNNKETKKKAVLTPKEKRAVKKAGKQSTNVLGN
jgi:hypothetical protein